MFGLFKKRSRDEEPTPVAETPVTDVAADDSNQDAGWAAALDDPEFVPAFLSALQRAGLTGSFEGDHVTLAGGSVMGLTTPATLWLAAEPEARRDALDAYVTTISRATSSDQPEPTLDSIMPKLADTSTLPQGEDLFSYSQEIVDGISVVMSVDRPDHVSLLGWKPLSALGDLPTVNKAAFDNLASHLRSLDWDVSTDDLDGGALITAVRSHDSYVSTGLTLLADVVQRATPGADTSHGVVCFIPDDHTLVYHVCHTLDHVFTVVNTLAPAAWDAYHNAGLSATPNLVFAHGDTMSVIAVSRSGDQLSIAPSPEFTEVLNTLSGDEESR